MKHPHNNRSAPARTPSTGKHYPLLLEWAWGQVEACADGSLNGEQQQRMRQAMALDPELRRAVGRAQAVLRDLRRHPAAPVPPRLWRRLWRIPAGGRRQPMVHRLWPGVAAAALATVLLVVVVSAVLQPAAVKPADTPLTAAQQQAAMHDFTTAMYYMKKTAALSGRATTRGMGGGLHQALVTSMNTWISDDRHLANSHFENGE